MKNKVNFTDFGFSSGRIEESCGFVQRREVELDEFQHRHVGRGERKLCRPFRDLEEVSHRWFLN
jgi:hypothetical protein